MIPALRARTCAFLVLFAMAVAAGLGLSATERAASASIAHGRQIWFENTYGGERFLFFLANHPDPARRMRIGFDEVLRTPRGTRFDVWGTINDPDCLPSADPASPYDVCPDPGATGVIGIRKAVVGSTTLYGMACAACHAGFDPLLPPPNANAPTWANIHPTIGNAYLQTGAIFTANMAATDVRRLEYSAWPRGTIDTTELFTDNIMNPGAFAPIWETSRKPSFDVGLLDPKVRNGHGAEDDLGLDVTALREYSSLGVCFAECTAPAIQTGQPISIDACRASCADLPTQMDLDDLATFLESIPAPQYPGARNGALYAHGKQLFDANCASCHDNSGKANRLLSNDEVNPIAGDLNAANACRALTTNWDSGRLWADFSSSAYKTRASANTKGYRTLPLAGIWATSPFLHNQSVGPLASATDTPSQRASAFEQAMLELLSPTRVPNVNRLPVAVGPFPAGTPLALIFSRDPSGSVLCSDTVENRGHYYGAGLNGAERAALIEYLKFQ
jgi:mono/diheme cytochrome c family protein